MKPACRLYGSAAFTECDSRFHFCINQTLSKRIVNPRTALQQQSFFVLEALPLNSVKMHLLEATFPKISELSYFVF